MKTIEHMPGTDAGSKYRIVAKKGRVCLGLKPFIIFWPNGCVGFNVRSAVLHEEIGDNPVTGPELTKPWPKIKFLKIDETRASVIVATTINMNYIHKAPKQVVKAANDFLTNKDAVLKTTKNLLDKLDVDISAYGTDKEIAAWFSDILTDGLEPIAAKINPVDETKVKAAVDEQLAAIFKTKT